MDYHSRKSGAAKRPSETWLERACASVELRTRGIADDMVNAICQSRWDTLEGKVANAIAAGHEDWIDPLVEELDRRSATGCAA